MMMKIVYTLKEELARDTEQVRVIQEVSLDKTKPYLGLSPRHALYGSEEWWRRVESGKIRRARYLGVINRLYHAGQDGDRSKPNSFRMKCDDGSAFGWTMIANDPGHKSLYTIRRRIEVTTIFVEVKRRKSFWERDYAELPLEISIQRRAPNEDKQ